MLKYFLILSLSFAAGHAASVPALPRSTPANQLVTCTENTPGVLCQNGIWFTVWDQIPLFKPAGSLTIINVTMEDNNSFNSQQIPFILDLTDLTLERIKTTNNAGTAVRFPLQYSTSRIRHWLISLTLDHIPLGTIRVDDFQGFRVLETLVLRSCDLVEIHPDAFSQGFSLIALAVLRIENDDFLTKFPWESLRPISRTLSTISFRNVSNLSAVTLPVISPVINLDKLEAITVQSTKLRSISQEVVQTWTARDVVMPVEIRFTDNVNHCGSCDLLPLIYYARNGSDSAGHRRRLLETSCLKNTAGEKSVYSGEMEFWRNFKTDDCQENVILPSGPGNNAGKAFCSLAFVAGCAVAALSLIL